MDEVSLTKKNIHSTLIRQVRRLITRAKEAARIYRTVGRVKSGERSKYLYIKVSSVYIVYEVVLVYCTYISTKGT